jgi:hypothetical protein
MAERRVLASDAAKTVSHVHSVWDCQGGAQPAAVTATAAALVVHNAWGADRIYA